MSKNKKQVLDKKKVKVSPQVRDPAWKLPAGQFQNNLRFITEKNIVKYLRKHSMMIMVIFSTLLIFLSIFVVAIDIYRTQKVNTQLGIERLGIENEINFWESISEKYPNYRDAYFKLAVLNYRLKNMKKSRENLEIVLRIDPNFKEGLELEEKLK